MTTEPTPSEPMASQPTASEPPVSFETALAELQTLVADLERGDAPLEDGLRAFERGVTLIRRCRGLLEAAEERVKILVDLDDAGRATFAPFEHNASHDAD
ncbi:MAG: exodeoxyribonuclease VII small subunit [Planctomycetia bacterium]